MLLRLFIHIFALRTVSRMLLELWEDADMLAQNSREAEIVDGEVMEILLRRMVGKLSRYSF